MCIFMISGYFLEALYGITISILVREHHSKGW
jgi:hypothetical protein